jgi:effector-binding domain-containing protein
MAIEEAKYTVVEKRDNFEIRDYAPHILAITLVDGDLEKAGNQAFAYLFDYISGNNQAQGKIAMTTPVSQEAVGRKIDMTAPVGQQRSDGKWQISFMMPATYTMETLPKPLDPKVSLQQVPARRMAAIRYSGFWSKEGYLRNKAALDSWIEKKGLKAIGEPVWARYNAPFSLWFLRRNEVLIPIAVAH